MIKITDSAHAAIIINELIDLWFHRSLLTCGNCGKIISVLSDREGDITCNHCNVTSEECNMPDLFY